MQQSDQQDSILSPDNMQHSWAERNGFADWGMALLWLFLCLTVLQIAAMIIAGVGYLLTEYLFAHQHFVQIIKNFQEGDTRFITQNLELLFTANSTWQILFLGLGTYYFVGLCSGKNRRKPYLRLKAGSAISQFIGVAVLLIIVVQPVVWFLGWINSFMPVPEVLQHLQQSQMELIGDFLKNNKNVAFALFNVAMVPAVCEEVLFRGFVFRGFEKKWGIKLSIILSGLLFGMYHIQVSNLLPLAFIGMLLAIIAWRSDSIYPAMVAHFINNGASVLIAVYYPESSLAETSATTMPPIWLVIVSGAISVYLLSLLININKSSGSDQ